MVVGLWEFASTDPAPPSVTFTLPAGVSSVVAYEWCTLHGLWKAAPIEV
jgi:desulfoferrodoxin (superoxide reductase-like protein)